MYKFNHYIVIIISMYSLELHGQLSPGPLSNAHSDLEGMSNCTQCHDIGKKVPDSKCLACHDEIQSLISSDRGYHASSEVSSMECIDCHSEHHGRKFEMVRFDTENFDHTLTSYDLEGQHARIDCRECHNSDNITDTELRARAGTWLGLEHDCLSCHDDYHQKSLGMDCTSCHNFEAFRPAPDFDHANAQYSLQGQHRNVECKECHPIETRNGKEFQKFKGIPFSDCASCHSNPHAALPGACASCHSVQGFDAFRGQSAYNHDLTEFRLKGKHRSVACFDCHRNTADPIDLFQDRVGLAENDCLQCHQDVHEGKFGLDCAMCHNENSFTELNADIEFDHSLTDFELEGLHASVDCASCHGDSYTDEIDFSYCRNCHEDFHMGQFVLENGLVEDCSGCHSVFEPFSFTSFGIEDHARADFPLDGAHVATPCFACHLDEASEEWTFRDIGQQCVDCHEDIHDSYISEKYYPQQNCLICHNTDSWISVSFEHELTAWPLENSHEQLNCRQCHFIESNGEFRQSFSNLSTNCFACHENVHGKQFELDGITDCARCHSTEGWSPELFDHSNTDFPLVGKHAELECSECHTRIDDEITIFEIERFECIDCHS